METSISVWLSTFPCSNLKVSSSPYTKTSRYAAAAAAAAAAATAAVAGTFLPPAARKSNRLAPKIVSRCKGQLQMWDDNWWGWQDLGDRYHTLCLQSHHNSWKATASWRTAANRGHNSKLCVAISDTQHVKSLNNPIDWKSANQKVGTRTHKS